MNPVCIVCGEKIYESTFNWLPVNEKNATNYTCKYCKTELELRKSLSGNELSIMRSSSDPVTDEVTEIELLVTADEFTFMATHKNFRRFLYSVEVSLPNEPHFEYQFNKDNLFKLYTKLVEDGYNRYRIDVISRSDLNTKYIIGNKEFMDFMLNKPELSSKPDIDESIEILEEVITKILDKLEPNELIIIFKVFDRYLKNEKRIQSLFDNLLKER